MANFNLPDTLVKIDWLRQHLDEAGLVLFDASWHMPASGRDGAEEWAREHIPGARFFDFDRRICDPHSELPHMMPSAEIFTREMQALGLNHDSRVVVYDTLGMFSAPRAWWMLRAMGFSNAGVLDGGLPAWKAAGHALESADQTDPYPQGNFVAGFQADLIADAQQVLAALDDSTCAVLDARPAPRFNGEAEEPRAGLRRGHMPGALNLPFADLFNDGLLKSKTELEQIFTPLIAGKERTLCSCGSGVTACVLAFAADYAGFERLTIYDGSWCEWGLPGDLPVVGQDAG